MIEQLSHTNTQSETAADRAAHRDKQDDKTMSRRSVLILGDGNFTFSSSLTRQIETHSLAVDLLCTSFDSHASLRAKYPETEHRLRELQQQRRREWVRLQHEVDATHISRSTGTGTGTVNESESERGFDDVVFNFPHLGYEDIRRHQCLLAHIMHSAKEVMSSEGGTLTIALAESQGIAWQIEEIAQRLGLVCRAKMPIRLSDWPGYEMKRHHTSRSFRSRVALCYHYVLCRETDRERNDSVLETLQRLREAENNKQADVSTETTVPMAPTEEGEKPVVAVNKPQKTKKRKVHQLVEGLYRQENTPTDALQASSSTGVSFVCTVCEKTFPTEQGVRTHVYSVHILPQQKSSDQSESAQPSAQDFFQCGECDRSFPNAEALAQHCIAKHEGTHVDLHAERGQSHSLSLADGAEEDGQFVCEVCLWRFPSLEALEHHRERDLIPVDAALEHCCQHCCKKFNDERAWKQHVNYCERKNDQSSIRSEQSQTS